MTSIDKLNRNVQAHVRSIAACVRQLQNDRKLEHQHSSDAILKRRQQILGIRKEFDLLNKELCSEIGRTKEGMSKKEKNLLRLKNDASIAFKELQDMKRRLTELDSHSAKLDSKKKSLERDDRVLQEQITKLESERQRHEKEKIDAGKIVLAIFLPGFGIPVIIAKLEKIKKDKKATQVRKTQCQAELVRIRRDLGGVNNRKTDLNRQYDSQRQRHQELELKIECLEHGLRLEGALLTKMTKLWTTIVNARSKYKILDNEAGDLQDLLELYDEDPAGSCSLLELFLVEVENVWMDSQLTRT